jgi:peptide/nickel transport system substrate-binding protein
MEEIMRTRKLLTWLAAIVILSLMMSACGGGATPVPATPAPTQPTKTSEPAGPKKGGTLTMVVWQEPEHLNWELGTQTVMDDINFLLIARLAKPNEKGDFVPVLAAEMPTTQNGGISADGKTITYKLKKDVKWHDGASFTCEDIQFTLKTIMTPNNGALDTGQFKDISAVECPDPNTAVIKFANFRADWIRFFSGIGYIFPKNAGKPEDLKTWAYNRKPIGTGPFKVDEFVTGDHITLSRNENYYVPDKPYLDKVIIRIVPSSEVAKQLLKNGEADTMWNNTEADLMEIEKMTNVKLSSAPQAGGERLILNLVKQQDATPDLGRCEGAASYCAWH